MSIPTPAIALRSINPNAFTRILEGGFRSGEMIVIGAYAPRPQPEGIRKLFAGEDDIVIGLEEALYLFGSKSHFVWNTILHDPVLLDRYQKATHIVYDTEIAFPQE